MRRAFVACVALAPVSCYEPVRAGELFVLDGDTTHHDDLAYLQDTYKSSLVLFCQDTTKLPCAKKLPLMEELARRVVALPYRSVAIATMGRAVKLRRVVGLELGQQERRQRHFCFHGLTLLPHSMSTVRLTQHKH